jgi:hypothetical protein
MLCQEQSLYKSGDGWIRVITLYCRAWSCPICRPRRRAQLIHEARDGHPTTFLTLTASPQSGATPQERARNLSHAWRRLRRKIIADFKISKLAFLAVFEATKAGEPHLHILARMPYVPQRWLSDQMAHLTSSPIVDIRRVRSAGQAASYVAKYIGKSPHRFAGCKRYWRSKDWLTPPDPSETHDWSSPQGWRVSNLSPHELMRKLFSEGWRFDAVTADEWIGRRARPPPDETDLQEASA